MMARTDTVGLAAFTMIATPSSTKINTIVFVAAPAGATALAATLLASNAVKSREPYSVASLAPKLNMTRNGANLSVGLDSAMKCFSLHTDEMPTLQSEWQRTSPHLSLSRFLFYFILFYRLPADYPA